MEKLIKRSFCAALALAFAPSVASAAPQGQAYPAIAAGLAIPSEARASRPFEARAAVRGRSVLIDAASATLYMMEGGRIVDSMKVIVGKPEAATPELRTTLTYATLNPYWHVPTDLARTLTAPNVLKQGVSYLTDRGYEVLSGFGPGSRVIDPASVDWKAVAEGRATAYVRQRPGPANSMGQMKFSLASSNEIYLHDTPRKELFEEEQRNLSAGCVRLEDAPRLASWLLGAEAQTYVSAPEQHIAIPRRVPITITYLDPQSQMRLAALR